MATNINMPHEGAFHMLFTYFGTPEKHEKENAQPFTVMFYQSDSATPLVFDDTDRQGLFGGVVNPDGSITTGDNTLPDKPIVLTDLSDELFDSYVVAGYTPAEFEFSRTSLNKGIKVVSGVPQIEFPPVKVTFNDGMGYIHGYAIVCSLCEDVIFRQLFDTPFNTSTVNGIKPTLSFIPTMKVGNAEGELT